VRIRNCEGSRFAVSRLLPAGYCLEPTWTLKVSRGKRTQRGRNSCRFDDLRNTFISRLAESSDCTVMALAGHVSRAMMERNSHIRMEAQRKAVDELSGAHF
jgi:hypothetical protein